MTIESLHDNYFDFLKLVDGICKKNQIPYFLSSGTLLGAVRHHDFIPWDDDVDLEVNFEDYPAFREAMRSSLPEHYHLIEPRDFAPGFFDFTIRIIRDDMPLRSPSKENDFYHNYQNRLGIDVFLLVKLPNHPLARHFRTLEYKVLNGLCMAYRYRLEYHKHSFIEKAQMYILSHIGRLIPLRTLHSAYEHINHRMDQKSAQKRIFCNDLVQGLGSYYEDSWHTGQTDGYLRDHAFPLPNGWDEMLTTLYGDYMTPPKQKVNERIHVDLERE